MVECRWTTGCVRRKIDCTRLGLCTDIDEVQSYLLELTDEIIEDVRKEQAARQRQQMKDLIRDYWEEIERKGQECVNAYLGQLCRNNAKFEGTLHCNKYEDKRVDITVSHLGMKFICDTFSGKSIASFFQEPTWIKSYLTITERNDRIMGFNLCRLGCCDWSKTKKVCKKTGTGSKRRHSISSIHKSSIIQAWVGWQGKGI